MKKFGFSHYRKFNGAPLEVLGRSGSEPTFWEFVQGIVREGTRSEKVNNRHKQALLVDIVSCLDFFNADFRSMTGVLLETIYCGKQA